MSYIETYSGDKFFAIAEGLEGINIDDIAKALSHTNRYNGHTELPYSVAEHSIHVASLLPPELQLMGLLHDASEAYIADIPSPFKPLIHGYEELEDHIMNRVWRKFGIPLELVEERYAEVKHADILMLCAESRNVKKSKGELFNDVFKPYFEKVEQDERLKDMPYHISPAIACGLFKKIFRMISEGKFLEGPFLRHEDMVKFLMVRG